MLKFEAVSRIYDDGTKAVDNVSLHVHPGEFCVLLGPSGAGKSTLMNLINGVTEPSRGTLRFNNLILNKKNKTNIQRSIGMIHQQLHLVPRLSVLHNVLTGLLPDVSLWRSLIKLFTPEEQRRACQLLDEVGLEEKHLSRRASNLSGGQQQRVAIARAFISGPKVVLADEPVASLDPAMSRSVLNSLKTAAENHNTTVLCTLHQLDYALEFADRIIALKNGRVFFDGHPSELDEETQSELYSLQQTQPVKLEKVA